MAKFINLKCAVCEKIFSRLLKYHTQQLKRNNENYSPICSTECKKKFRSKKQTVSCDNCQIIFEKQAGQINKSDHNFCSQSCSAIFNNKQRQTKSKEVEVFCKYCKNILLVKRGSTKKVCDDCKKSRKKENNRINHRLKPSNCITCNVALLSSDGRKKYCDVCRLLVFQELGKKNSKLSVAVQVRRSKNEIYFADLCVAKFNKVSTNDPIFVSKYGNWDADVIIHDHKIAVLWNGIWHYQQVRKNHSLAQVQSRDKIKIDVIKDNGYISYVVKDLGKHSKSFVEKEFEKFLEFVNNMAV